MLSVARGKGNGLMLLTINYVYGNPPVVMPVGTKSSQPVFETCLTHGFLLLGEDVPICAHCDSLLSVAHILIDCPFYQKARDIYQLHGTIWEKLQDNCVFKVLAFLNYIQVYKTI
jgi:hypothetical protein